MSEAEAADQLVDNLRRLSSPLGVDPSAIGAAVKT
jgi:phage terminase small subunit